MNAPNNMQHFAREYRQLAAAPASPHFIPAAAQTIENVSAFLPASPRLAATNLLEKLGRTVHEIAGGQVLIVRVRPSDAGEPVKDWSPLNSLPYSHYAFGDQTQQLDRGLFRVFLRVSAQAGEKKYLSAFLGHCARHFKHVLVDLDPESGRSAITECLRRARLGFGLLRQTADGFKQFREFDSWLDKRGRAGRGSLKPVLCVGAGELAQTYTDIVTALGKPPHLHLRDCPDDDETLTLRLGCDWPGGFCFDLRRWAREIGRCRVGLALSSGGAKGFAYVGVIQVLEQHGIEVDAIAGCSMGAYIGALWAAGHDSKFILRRALELQGRWSWWKLIDPVFPPRRGFIHGRKVRKLLRKSIGEVQFCDLVRPLRVVATNLATLERKAFASGEVASAVQASCAIPGVCVPIQIGDETYVDGGISDPLPVGLLREMGIERVIAVNTVPTPALLRCAREREREIAERLRRRPWWKRFFNEHFNYFARGNILDIIQQSVLGAQIPNAEEACRQADVVLRPLIVDSQWHDFSHPRRYIAQGRRVALEQLAELKALAGITETVHEHPPAQHALASVA